jgi:hypothetical protein
MVTDSTQEMVVLSVISRLAVAVVELNAIVNIDKYRGFHEGHHFIPMARKCTTHLGVIWIISLGNVPVFFMIDVREVVFLYSIFQATC